MIRLQALRERLRISLWFLPAVFALAAVGLAVVLAAVDRRLGDTGSLLFTFGRTAEGARAVLSAIAQSMLTFTGLVFTITMLVLQLASSQLSPRVMRTFLRDRANQIVLGLFVATFVYTLLLLREVRTPVDGDSGFVPAISIWVAFALLLASVGAFIYYIDHMAHAIRASTVIVSIWRETVAAIDRLFPEGLGDEPSEDLPWPNLQQPDIVLKAQHAGVLVRLDEDQLLAAAATGDRALALTPAVGDFVAEGSPLAHLWGFWDDEAVHAVLGATSQGDERTLEQDAAFGLRQLVDIAIRALSPGTNDPTTAVQALDRIHDLLRRLAMRRFPSRARAVDGRVRMLLDAPGWDDFVRLGLDEIRLAGGSQIQVARRLRAILDDLATVAPGPRQAVLDEEIAALEAGVERGFRNDWDHDVAAEPSARGHALGSRTRSRW
ncbi:MAG: DUF2254 domain-containing protein [Candidatus Limnocylindrales bacterium]